MPLLIQLLILSMIVSKYVFGCYNVYREKMVGVIKNTKYLIMHELIGKHRIQISIDPLASPYSMQIKHLLNCIHYILTFQAIISKTDSTFCYMKLKSIYIHSFYISYAQCFLYVQDLGKL